MSKSYVHQNLLSEIEAFLTETGMGASYFGKIAAKNSELVQRLREGRPILTQTEQAVRAFINARRSQAVARAS